MGGVIPFGLNGRGMPAWLTYGGGADLLNEFYNGEGLHYRPAGNTGAQIGRWFREKITSAADIEGLTMRIGGLAGRMMEKLGAVPQQIAGGDIYPSLERGTIDAAEWIGPYDDEDFGFDKVAPQYCYPGWWEGNLEFCCFVNTDNWNELPEAYESLPRPASIAATNEMLSESDYQNPTALKELIPKGAQLRNFPQDVMLAAFDASREVYSEINADTPAFKTLYDSMMAFRAETYLRQQVSEYTFDTFMRVKQREGALQMDG